MIGAAVAAVVGFAVGAAWLATLRINTGLYLGGGAWWRPVGLQLLRLAGVGVAFAILAHAGALALLAALAGFLAARAVLLRGRRVRT